MNPTNPAASSGGARARARLRPALHAALVVAAVTAGVALRATNLGGPAFSIDEFFHPFAARSVLAGEGFQLPSGHPYTRGWPLTLLVAGAFALFGEGEATARLPALAFGILTLPLVYVTGRLLFGPTAGLVALLLLAFSPDAIDVARFVRVYSPLTFFVLLAALAAFRALEEAGEEGPRLTRGRVGWLALSAGAGLAAVELHSVAVGLVLAIQLYAAAMGLALLLQGRTGPAGPYGAIAAGLLLLEALAVVSPDLRARLVEVALTPLPWYGGGPGDVGNYHGHLAANYAWLWYLTWPATLVLVLARPRAGLFVAIAFWVPLVLLSGVVPTKQIRYVAHLLPFAWLLLGGVAEALWPAARAALLARLAPWLPAWVPHRAVVAAVLLLAVAPLARVTPSVMTALRRPSQMTGAFTTSDFYDWRGLARVVGPYLGPQVHVLSSVPLAIHYYLSRPAHRLVAAFYRRTSEEGLVQRPADFAALRAGGLPLWVIVERWRWAQPGQLDDGLKRRIADECRAVTLPPDLAFVVFACDGPYSRRGVAHREEARG